MKKGNLMSITVKQLSDNFKYLKFDDFKYLTGKSSNIQDDDTVSLSKLATYNKRDIQVFTAKKEGENFLNMLNGSYKTDITKSAGLNKKISNGKKTNPFISKNENGAKRNFALQAYVDPERKAWIG